jgi:Temperature dependent protein affecting M2 dsRNA replication
VNHSPGFQFANLTEPRNPRFLINSHAHSPLARAMYTAIRTARVNDKFQDPLYLFLELIRAGVMHGHLWSNRAFSGGPSFGTGE